jgi:hypothetical protein
MYDILEELKADDQCLVVTEGKERLSVSKLAGSKFDAARLISRSLMT